MKLKVMETQQDLHRGFLLLPPVGKLIKKSWQKKYCRLFKSSKFGLGRLEIYDTQDTKVGQPKIITLENVIKIMMKDEKTFSILTKNNCEHEFMVVEEDSLSDWITAIQTVAFPDEVSKVTSIVEDNDLYCSSGEGVFYVKLHPSSVSERCNLQNKDYILLLTDTALQLRTMEENKLLYTWPYCYIRRYGYKHGKFTFEAGRKCDSGEGTFYLEHSNHHEIFRCLATKMKSMKQLLTNNGSMCSLLSNNEELQFFEARNMKAGSRSPLPISSQVTTGSMQDSLNTMFNRSFSQISQSTSRLDTQPTSVTKPLIRPKPKIRTSKPSILRPAPSAPNLNLNLSSAKSKESVMSDYEPIGTVNDEQVKTPDREEADHTQPWNKLKQELENVYIDKTLGPAVITEPTSTLDGTDYDKLNFFGSTSRLNHSSGYKPVPFHHTTSAPSFNQYDEVSPIEPVRSADDSHLGYAKIRKDPLNNSLKEVNKEVSHQYTNREPYAVISKAKHV